MKVLVIAAVLVCGLCALALAEESEAAPETSWWFSDSPAQRPKRGKAKTTRSASTASSRPSVACATDRLVCQNFDDEAVKLINQQITEELKASYAYQAMAFYFGRDDIAMRGFSKFFKKMSDEERDHAQIFMNYLNKRGGELIFLDIPKPSKEVWGSGLEAMKTALAMEHFVNSKILDVHWLAQEKNDPHLQDFLEGEFLTEQADSAKQLSDYIAVLERVKGTPVGEFMFDQELYDGKR